MQQGVGDLLVEENLAQLAWVLAPLLFLPVLSLRKLVPAVPITVLYLIADVSVAGPDGGGVPANARLNCRPHARNAS